jgi:hypothetical protein
MSKREDQAITSGPSFPSNSNPRKPASLCRSGPRPTTSPRNRGGDLRPVTPISRVSLDCALRRTRTGSPHKVRIAHAFNRLRSLPINSIGVSIFTGARTIAGAGAMMGTIWLAPSVTVLRRPLGVAAYQRRNGTTPFQSSGSRRSPKGSETTGALGRKTAEGPIVCMDSSP